MDRAYKYLSSQIRNINIESFVSPSEWYRHIAGNLRTCREHVERIPLGALTKVLVAFTMLLAVVMVYFNWAQLEGMRDAMRKSPWGVWFLATALTFMAINLAYFIWQVVCFCRYRPSPPATDEQLPTCTVVVPAYNEGQQVLVTLRSLAASDFPAEKLQLIAVDDGSRDDTWHWMCEAKKELGDRVQVIQLPKNAGKRHALNEGFLKATGEILVTVDSDSIVEPCTLRHLLSPFVGNPTCGAVAGNVRVLNLHEGLIPRMLDVSFVYSFEFVRSAQSMVDCVLCTPGALSAYRREPTVKVLPEWLNQTFFGKKSDIGEDRAMTNMILRQGYTVLFQENSMVYTNVPTTYRNLCKMLIRWARSAVRENVDMNRFAFSKFREGSCTGARIHLLMQWVWTFGTPVFLIATFVCLVWQPFLFTINVLGGLAVMCSVPALLYAWRCRAEEAVWAYAFGMFNLAALSWIGPYSLLTVHKSGWLTRQLPAAAPAPVPVEAKPEAKDEEDT